MPAPSAVAPREVLEVLCARCCHSAEWDSVSASAALPGRSKNHALWVLAGDRGSLLDPGPPGPLGPMKGKVWKINKETAQDHQ